MKTCKGQPTTTGPPGSYARLKHMTTLAFGFRHPEVYCIAKEVKRAVDLFHAGQRDYLDLNSILEDCARDVLSTMP